MGAIKLKRLSGRTEVSDSLLYNNISINKLMDRVRNDLGVNLGLTIVREMYGDIFVKRVYDPNQYIINRPGVTEYEVNVWLITDEEAKEYEALKEYKKQMEVTYHDEN